MSAACPHLCAPGAPCPRWAHHNVVSFRKQADSKAPRDHIPDNGKAERLVDAVPQGRWKTATFLAALRKDRIDAPCLFDGPINGERFHAYVEQVPVPTLKPGDVVILDNLGSHKGKAVRRAIRDVGARLVFLPKYSPDLNPIEQVFAKFKTLLRKVGARTYEAISDACGEILRQYPPAECAAYLKNAGSA